ncbi:hypothetical protein TSUD_346810 [Trifolium subterraneum]|nr:hypothetical protein TSUD_346810 [Trifolium subterraneum]
MEYKFKAKDIKELMAANGGMQQKPPGSIMGLYIYTAQRMTLLKTISKGEPRRLLLLMATP